MSVFVIGEIGINHNGSIDLAKKIIDVAVRAGVNAVKFQKRDINSGYINGSVISVDGGLTV